MPVRYDIVNASAPFWEMKKASAYFQSFIHFWFELSSFADKCTARWLLMISNFTSFLVQTQEENFSLFIHFWSHDQYWIFGIDNVGRGTSVIDWKKVIYVSFWPAEHTCHVVTSLFIFEAVHKPQNRQSLLPFLVRILHFAL